MCIRDSFSLALSIPTTREVRSMEHPRFTCRWRFLVRRWRKIRVPCKKEEIDDKVWPENTREETKPITDKLWNRAQKFYSRTKIRRRRVWIVYISIYHINYIWTFVHITSFPTSTFLIARKKCQIFKIVKWGHSTPPLYIRKERVLWAHCIVHKTS